MRPFRPLRLLLTALFSASTAAIAADPSLPGKRLACIGDSITEGFGSAPGKSYPAQLQELLGKDWNVGNFGLGGRTLMNKGDVPYMKERAYQESLAFKPEVVIIMLGTNDSKPQNWKFESEFVADYTTLVKSFQALETKPKIFVCRPCPVLGDGSFGITEGPVKEEIKRIDQLAKELDLPVIDMHAALEPHPEMLPDKVHPNTEGSGVMARTAYKALTGKDAPEAKPAPAKEESKK